MRTLELIHSLKKYTLLAVVLSCVPQLWAQWTAVVGAQSPDQARQALAFLPNEMWIHAGDNITLTVVTNMHARTNGVESNRGHEQRQTKRSYRENVTRGFTVTCLLKKS